MTTSLPSIPHPSLELPGGPLIRTLEGHSGAVTSVAVVDGTRVVSASGDRTVKVWDLAFGQTLATARGDAGFQTCTMLPSGIIVAGEAGGRIYAFRLEMPAAAPDPAVQGTPWAGAEAAPADPHRPA